MKTTNRNMVWHELYNRMKDDKCPICELIHSRVERSMGAFLYEGVNDTALRSKICSSNGFCNYHAYMLMEMGDPLAHALIYNDLLDRAIHSIGTPSPKQSNSPSIQQDCLYCQLARENEGIYIGAFVKAFRDDEFADQYTSGGLLCVPHLELIKKTKNPKFAKIQEITLKKYKALISHLSEIKRKSDYRYSHEPWTEQEKEAWKKAVSVINSHEGL